MAQVDGSWDCVVKSPLGDQKMMVTIQSEGSTFTGTASGAMGTADLSGEVLGDTISWQQSITSPMPLTLDVQATADGDTLTGTVGAGGLGSFPLNGTRVG